eukprot:TRINITY_DN966_c3_g1_i1.p1 TRINITY_DN966_c3_g1~~TRINITY_DN966_c3_g1_i1.p1  ORF type:complete len:399 (+),score=56.48 TRINITY_DN966_c3_g1_i1:69-1199(+)
MSIRTMDHCKTTKPPMDLSVLAPADRQKSSSSEECVNLGKQILYSRETAHTEHIEGPVMFTAPHGLELYRGGEFGERRRVHLKERWVTELVLKLSIAVGDRLSKHMGTSSFIIWNPDTAVSQDPMNLDPNYLTASDFKKSPWHKALLKWKDAFQRTNLPILHIDIHGKMDRKDNLDMDLGAGAMEAVWGRDHEVTKKVKQIATEEFRSVFLGRRCYGYKRLRMGVESEPQLKGHNNRGFHTTTHQSALLGIPALQLELPRTLRRALCIETHLFGKFVAAIANIYLRCFKPPEVLLHSIPPHYPPCFQKQLLLEEDAETIELLASTPSSASGFFKKKLTLATHSGRPAAVVKKSHLMVKQLLQMSERVTSASQERMI